MASSPSSPEISAAAGAETHPGGFSYKHATEEEIMEDLSSRFILNLPDEELTSLERICFQVEQAHWFYEDFIREENRRCHSLPLKKFTAMMFAACPILQQWDHEEAFQKFMQYKTLVPVCGAIMLNESWDKCVLVKGWKSSSGWGFPKGKINETEPKPICAVREVLEETGYNLAGQINPDHFIETTNNGQRVTLFIVPGVPEDYPFRTKTRKEISKIEWFKLTDLPSWRRNKHAPGKFYLIAPFIGPLKAFVNANKPRKTARKVPSTPKPVTEESPPQESQPATVTDSDALVDSSSQSSSLDNNGPQTPSPQYSESAPASVPTIAKTGEPTNLDPHFARLLSNLTLSVSTPTENSKIPAAPESNLLQTIFDSQPVQRSSQPAPHTAPPPAPVPPSQPAAAAKSTPEPPQQVSTSLPKVAQQAELRSEPVPIISGQPETQSLAVTNGALGSSMLSTSPRSPVFRKSTTADISPYLTRPMATEVPVSAKRLQQLALLESVANESARMTPKLTSRTPAPYSPGLPNPLPSIPDSRMYPAHPASPARQQAFGTPSFIPGPGNIAPPGPQYPHDPFIRSRTSQAIHRPGFHSPPGSASMNHNQLLALINNAPLGMAAPQMGPQPLRGPPPPMTFQHQGPTYPPFGAPHPHAGVQPLPSAPLPQHPRQYDAFYPSSPGPRAFSVAPTGTGPKPSAEALLSILNAVPNPPQFSRA